MWYTHKHKKEENSIQNEKKEKNGNKYLLLYVQNCWYIIDDILRWGYESMKESVLYRYGVCIILCATFFPYPKFEMKCDWARLQVELDNKLLYSIFSFIKFPKIWNNLNSMLASLQLILCGFFFKQLFHFSMLLVVSRQTDDNFIIPNCGGLTKFIQIAWI